MAKTIRNPPPPGRPPAAVKPPAASKPSGGGAPTFTNRPPRPVYDPSVGGGGGQPSGGFRPQAPRPGRQPEGPPSYGPGGGGAGPNPYMPQPPGVPPAPPTTPDDFGAGTSFISYTPPPSAFSASEMLENLLYTSIGVKGLGPWAADLYNRGASPTEIVQALRYGTDKSEKGQQAYRAYLDAFPQMDKFLAEKIFPGENPEMQYLEYRNTVKEAGARFNVNQDLFTNTKIADYISGRNSAAEIVNRMNMASVAVASTPADTISTLRDYYGLASNDLMSFYLDTDQTEAMLQQRYAAAQIGSEALRQQLQSDRAYSEQLAARGITTGEAKAGFQKVAGQREFEAGRGETATQRELANAAFGDQGLAQKVERIGASRAGAFQGGGGYTSASGGTRTGLGGSSA